MEHGEVGPGRLVVVRLDPGEDLITSLQRVCGQRGIKHGVILAGYGALRRVRFHSIVATDYPPVNRFIEREAPLELLSLNGIIANGDIHAHVVVSDLEKAVGGHLEKGTEVAYLAEIAILEVASGQLTRGRHPVYDTECLRIPGGTSDVP